MVIAQKTAEVIRQAVSLGFSITADIQDIDIILFRESIKNKREKEQVLKGKQEEKPALPDWFPPERRNHTIYGQKTQSIYVNNQKYELTKDEAKDLYQYLDEFEVWKSQG